MSTPDPLDKLLEAAAMDALAANRQTNENETYPAGIGVGIGLMQGAVAARLRDAGVEMGLDVELLAYALNRTFGLMTMGQDTLAGRISADPMGYAEALAKVYGEYAAAREDA